MSGTYDKDIAAVLGLEAAAVLGEARLAAADGAFGFGELAARLPFLSPYALRKAVEALCKAGLMAKRQKGWDRTLAYEVIGVPAERQTPEEKRKPAPPAVPKAEESLPAEAEDTEFPETEMIKGEPFNVKHFVAFWNLTTCGVFGNVRYPLGKVRRTQLVARVREHGKSALREALAKAMASSFLKGGNSRGFTMTFDWFIKPTNFEKIISGNYDNKTQSDAHNKGLDSGGDTLNKNFAYFSDAFGS